MSKLIELTGKDGKKYCIDRTLITGIDYFYCIKEEKEYTLLSIKESPRLIVKETFSEIIELIAKSEVKEKKPYEISYPNDGEKIYYISHYFGQVKEWGFNISNEADKCLYDIGLYFDTKEEAEQFKRERSLIKKIKCWAKEQQGDWEPDWKERTMKYFINILHNDRSVSVRRAIGFDVLPKLPHFKTEEIAQACIDEFGDEILEVFC